jgi:tetratricopeptide (TPR) repeat protein
MFMHAGFRPLWPVILFLPWVLLGAAYLLESALHRSWAAAARHAGRQARRSSLGIVALAFLVAAAPLALADPAFEEHPPCPAPTREQARSLADALFEQGAYQHAGECYQAAGELALADRAFVRAVEPESTATAHKLADQGDQAKALARKVQRAFRTDH